MNKDKLYMIQVIAGLREHDNRDCQVFDLAYELLNTYDKSGEIVDYQKEIRDLKRQVEDLVSQIQDHLDCDIQDVDWLSDVFRELRELVE